MAVLLLNKGDYGAANISVHFVDIPGVGNSTTMLVKDVWDASDPGVIERGGGLVREVESHGTVVLTLHRL